jgi:2-C-methyl-D-erythritol 4-phosphate cytidylyltransferase
MAAVIAPLRDQGAIRLVAGGELRQDSVAAGLKAVDPSARYVMVHDAARPFVTRELIEAVLAAAQETGAAVCGLPCTDTLKQVGDDNLVRQTVDRSTLWNVQTPQIFQTQLLREAYQIVGKLGLTFTDDTAVVEKAGYPVQVVPYEGINLKVTTPTDWKLAQAYLRVGDDNPEIGPVIRKHLHDLNNHLTPLLGYAYLLASEFPEESKGRKFATAIQGAGERCQTTAAALQKVIREVFPRKGE